MSHDVFISHSSIDKNVADAVCATLEKEGVRCWIAPRDIRPGDSWGSSIIKAIEVSQVMVVIFSGNSNDSKQVMREVERAVQKDVVVVPIRIEEVQPSADMEYFLSATHWLDALTPEMDAHLEKLTTTVQSILSKTSGERPAVAAPVVPSPAKEAHSHSKPVGKGKTPLIFGIAAAVAIVLSALWFMVPSKSGEGATNPIVGDGNIRIEVAELATGAELADVKVIGKSGERDYIAIGKSDSQDSSKLEKADVAGEKTVRIEIPDKEGLYEVRYFDGVSGKVVARHALKVKAPEVTLEAVSESLAGTDISVTWTAPNNKGDFLSFAKKGSADSKYVHYSYTSKGSPTSIRVPTVEGEYEIRYISGQSKTAWARHDFVALAPEASVAVQESAVAGSTVVVDWTGPALKGDFVAIAEPGTEGKTYVGYKYAREGQKVEMLAPVDPGVYEVRYISGGSYIIRSTAPIKIEAVEAEIAEVEEVEPGVEFVVNWTGPDYRGDYVAIFNVGDSNGKYLSYRYTRYGNALKLTAPEEPGTYELRYISGQKAQVWATRQFVVAIAEEEASL